MNSTTKRMNRLRGVVLTAITLLVVTGCSVSGPATPEGISTATAASAQLADTGVSDLEIEKVALAVEAEAANQAAKQAEAVRVAEQAKAEADALALKAQEEATAASLAAQKVVPEAPAPVAKAAPVAASQAATVANFHNWVNYVLNKYGVAPGPNARFVVGDTSWCGGYMCITVQRYDTTVLSSVVTVSPGAIGNEFALVHEVGHTQGVGFKDTGGECAADAWARQYLSGSTIC